VNDFFRYRCLTNYSYIVYFTV